MSRVAIVIPTYNEAGNLPKLIPTLFDLPIEYLHVLIVDDNSPDGSGRIAEELAQQYSISVLHRKDKAGLGPAYIAGFKEALKYDVDYILQMDADFSHQPEYIPEMVTLIEKGADMVLGSRFVRGGSVDQSWGLYRKLLSYFANRVYIPLILHIPISDATGGFRLWRHKTLRELGLDRIQSNGYVFQVEMLYLAIKLGFKVVELPIHFPDRKEGESKMRSSIAFEAARQVFNIRRRYQALDSSLRLYKGLHP